MTRVNLDGEDPAAGLAALVLTVIDLLLEVLEREAVRRMEGDRLSDEEVERLGAALAEIEAEVDRLIAEYGVEDEVQSLRGDLDGLVKNALDDVPAEAVEKHPPSGRRTPAPPSSDPSDAPLDTPLDAEDEPPGQTDAQRNPDESPAPRNPNETSAPRDPNESPSERDVTSPDRDDDRGTESEGPSDRRRIDRGGESDE